MVKKFTLLLVSGLSGFFATNKYIEPPFYICLIIEKNIDTPDTTGFFGLRWPSFVNNEFYTPTPGLKPNTLFDCEKWKTFTNTDLAAFALPARVQQGCGKG